MLIFAPENHLQKRAQRGGGLRDEVYNMRMEETCKKSGTTCVPEPQGHACQSPDQVRLRSSCVFYSKFRSNKPENRLEPASSNSMGVPASPSPEGEYLMFIDL
jgi:hypothetical protein